MASPAGSIPARPLTHRTKVPPSRCRLLLKRRLRRCARTPAFGPVLVIALWTITCISKRRRLRGAARRRWTNRRTLKPPSGNTGNISICSELNTRGRPMNFTPEYPLPAELTDAVEAVDHPTALENILFGRFGIDDLRGFAFPLAILLGQVGDGFARVGPCPGRILDARRRVGQDPHLIIGRRDAAAQTDGHKQYRPPHGLYPHVKVRGLQWYENRAALTSALIGRRAAKLDEIIDQAPLHRPLLQIWTRGHEGADVLGELFIRELTAYNAP